MNENQSEIMREKFIMTMANGVSMILVVVAISPCLLFMAKVAISGGCINSK